jgi:uncharacterized membrane protein YfcA
MPDSATLAFIALVFVLAGFVKGVIGLGLPTIGMGLLAVVMAPVQAAAILVLPSLVTNVWQMVRGPGLRPLLRRLWPMLLGVSCGTWGAAGLMTGAYARHGAIALGVALMLYALSGLLAFRIRSRPGAEPWLGAAIGGVTGVITAATGVFVIPAVPYMGAIGLEKEELVQALGLSFTVSTLALSANLALGGALRLDLAGPTLLALAASGVGMAIGQALRLRLSPAAFRRWFFVGLLLLGAYLVARATA